MSNNIDIRIRASTEGSEQIKQLNKTLSDLGKIESFKKLKKQVEESREAWQNAQEQVVELAREIRNTENPTQALTNQFEAAKREAAGLKETFIENRNALVRLRNGLQDTGVDT